MNRLAILATGFALGMAPALAIAAPDQPLENQAGPAAIPDATVGKAGAALHDVAKLQEKYQGKMDSASPEQKRSLGEQANAEAVQAIQSHGISVQEYASVVRTAQNNPRIKQHLLEAAKQGD